MRLSTILFITFLTGLFFTNNALSQCAEWTHATDGTWYVQKQHSIDHDGNLYLVVRRASGLVTIGDTTFTTIDDVLLLKFDPEGTVLWTKIIDGSTNEDAFFVKSVDNGKLLVGLHAGDSLNIGGSIHTVASQWNIKIPTIAQIDATTGNVDWVQSFPTSDHLAYLRDAEIDEMGNVYLVGYFKEDLMVGSTTLSPTSRSPLVVKLDPNGAIVWHRSYTSIGGAYLTDIAVFDDGTSAITGWYKDDYPIDLGGVTLPANDNNDHFLLSLDNQGNTLWAKSVKSGSYYATERVVFNSKKECYMTGNYRDSLTIDGTTIYQPYQTPWYTNHLCKFDASGTLLWMKDAGAKSVNYSDAEIAVDASDNIYWTPNIDMNDTSAFYEFVPHPEGHNHLVKYDRFGNVLWAISKLGSWDYLSASNSNEVAIQGRMHVPFIAFDNDTVRELRFHAIYKRDLQEFMIEDFDGQPTCTSTSSQPGSCPRLTNGWTNEPATDQLDWSVGDANTLHLAGTGPDAPRLTDQYMFFSTQNTTQGQTAELIRPCIDISRHANPHLTFFYHMHGADMGTLHVDIRTNGVWTNDVWTKQGQQQANSTDAWRQADIDLTSFIADGIIDIRFRAEAGNGDLGNMAIDEVYVLDNPDCDLSASVSANTTIQQGCDSATLDVTITGTTPNFQAASLTVIGLDQLPGVDPTLIETTWYDDQGNILSTSTGLSMPPLTVSPSATTTYTVEVTNYYCTAQGQVTVTVVPCATAIEEDIRFASLQLFPNPTENYVNISLDWDQTTEAQIHLLNTQGQILKETTEHIQGGTNTFSVSTGEYPTGIYFLRILIEDKLVTRRVVVN